MRQAIVWATALAVITCLVPTRAQAQDAEVASIALGYSLLEITDSDVTALPAGWLFSGSRRLGGVFSVVGEVGGNYRQSEGDWFSIHTFMGGVRFSPARPGVSAFGQFLVGAVTAACCDGSATYMAIEPGGGVEIPVGTRAALRLGASVPLIFAEGRATAMVRVQTGLVFRVAAH